MKGRRREDRDGTEMALKRGDDGGREESGAAEREERRRRGRVGQRGNTDGAARKEAEGETSQRSGT